MDKASKKSTWVPSHFLYIGAAPPQCYALIVKAQKKKKMRSMRAVVVGLVVVAAVVCGWGNVQMASADTSPSQCKEERNLLVNACRPVLFGRSPSADCCQRVRVSQVECVCPYVTPKTASIIGAIGSVGNVVKKIEGCGRTVPHKFKCGSITTP